MASIQTTGVTIVEQGAAREMVERPLGHGHRGIVHVTSHLSHGASAWRQSGDRETLDFTSLSNDPPLVVEGDFSFASGVAAAKKLFSRPKRPAAIFAANDQTAAGVV